MQWSRNLAGPLLSDVVVHITTSSFETLVVRVNMSCDQLRNLAEIIKAAKLMLEASRLGSDEMQTLLVAIDGLVVPS